MGEMTNKGKIASIVEYIFGAFFVLTGIGNFGTSALAAIGYILFGIFLILCGLIWTQLRSICQKYNTLLANDPSKSINALATSTNSSVSVVRSNIELLIKKKLVENVAIDVQKNCIVVGQHATQNNSTPESDSIATTTSNPTEVEALVVECSGCGAKNTINKGQAVECEHCGTVISA